MIFNGCLFSIHWLVITQSAWYGWKNNKHGGHIVLTCDPLCRSLIGPQDQYQYLYKALLSLIGPTENSLGLLAGDTNGTTASMSDQAESMESLV